jgi:hypothetical protein
MDFGSGQHISKQRKQYANAKNFFKRGTILKSEFIWEVMGLVKKAKKAEKKRMIPDPSALEGIPTHNDPHAEFAKKDAAFKKQRGAK